MLPTQINSQPDLADEETLRRPGEASLDTPAPAGVHTSTGELAMRNLQKLFNNHSK